MDILAGIKLFNNADFFSAHDFFEDRWVECNREERLFFQGLVHVSVGCYHLISGNYKGSLSQFTKGKNKLSGYLPSYHNINLQILVNDIEFITQELNSGSSNIDPKKFWNRIPKFEINS